MRLRSKGSQMDKSERNLAKWQRRLERRLFWRNRLERFKNTALGVFLRRIWWHVCNPTKWPERMPTKAEIAAFREQMRRMPR